ncbi:MAG: hypothetical protein QOG34_782 [Frankiaceae bacterium]|jgi:uncharacterized protein YceK|nr:hypothetical protein [Frankiaceae bacterium]
MMRKVAVVLATAATLLLAAGCGGATSTSGPGNPSGQNGTVSLDEKANGTTVHVHFGDTVTVTLHSTYWSFLPTGGLALQPFAPAQTAPSTGCGQPVGSGCGTVTASFNVGHVGTTTLRAHRDTCGEALRCTGDQADWSVTVVAS